MTTDSFETKTTLQVIRMVWLFAQSMHEMKAEAKGCRSNAEGNFTTTVLVPLYIPLEKLNVSTPQKNPGCLSSRLTKLLGLVASKY
eukprot:CAMPEP_0118717896 /NCGR_PEP_ID=MMETSP0800-20121206/28456_1 /TAXON_ID=210618 ORGANISM="Striatella unipunctata, Strain CCMP2910" /NCGR_SAMPLE_ID=MMETSP0800 /ASSEMBLY_ACC=CAM_ASM_000638 /LENGTH=85 /DNA_ID=CAMNT_0006624769 /DNA_START=480 /DNA_END=734 /DNA_ORIENTATION=-